MIKKIKNKKLNQHLSCTIRTPPIFIPRVLPRESVSYRVGNSCKGPAMMPAVISLAFEHTIREAGVDSRGECK